MYFDTHAHLDAYAPDELDGVLARAAAARVRFIVAPGGSPQANEKVLELAAKHAGHILPAVGLDRDQANAPHAAEGAAPWLRRPGVVAVGEIGLDYFYSPDTAGPQRELFAAQLAQAREAGLPVIVHSRAADSDTLAALREHARSWRGDPARIGVLHCFTGSASFARAALDLGFMISFSGILTFRNAAELRSTARQVPDDRLLIETDAPWLAPEPYRGRPNEPARIVRVAEVMAEVRGVSVERIAQLTTANALRLFCGVHAAVP